MSTSRSTSFDFQLSQKYTVTMSVLIETVLGRLGSRFSLSFHPCRKQLWTSPLGRLYDRPIRLEISMVAGDKRLMWPFSSGEQMDVCEQQMTMTSVGFRCISVSLGVELLIRFVAPFYPQDEKLSVAPFFYIDLVCKPMSGATERTAGEIKVALLGSEDDVVARDGSGVTLQGAYRLTPDVSSEEADEFSRGDFGGTIALAPIRGKLTLKESTFSIPYSVDEGATTRATFALAAHCDEPVLEVEGTPHRFRYLRWFPSLADVTAFAKDGEASIAQRSDFFDELFLRSSLGQSAKNLIAHSFQSHLSATWWTEPATGDGAEWFGFWDSRAFHNAAEAEYASSLLYLNLWPDLLEKQLNQRASLEKESGVLPVNCGRFLSVQSSDARPAGVEESCDFLLMLFAHWRWWNRFEPIERNASLIRRLGGFLLHSDPARPGRSSVQTRLVLKTLCALEAVAVMAEELDDGDLSDSCRDAVRAMRTQFEEHAWARDHFIVRLGGSESGEREHYSICTPDGLLHHLMCDSFPELDYGRFRQDILSSASNTLSRYGSAAAAAEPERFSILDNVWRDVVAAYLGIDFSRMTERYRDFCVSANASEPGGRRVDPPSSPNLLSDARGASTMGLLQALLGLKLDRVERSITISPLSIPAEAPILPLADWERGLVPRASVGCEGNQMRVDVSERDLVDAAGDLAIDPHPELRWGGS